MHSSVTLVCDITEILAAHQVICNAVGTFWWQQLGARRCLASRNSLINARRGQVRNKRRCYHVAWRQHLHNLMLTCARLSVRMSANCILAMNIS